jgi:hypothetical protein
MTSDNRKYNYTGELTLKRRRVLKVENQPKVKFYLAFLVVENGDYFFLQMEEP